MILFNQIFMNYIYQQKSLIELSVLFVVFFVCSWTIVSAITLFISASHLTHDVMSLWRLLCPPARNINVLKMFVQNVHKTLWYIILTKTWPDDTERLNDLPTGRQHSYCYCRHFYQPALLFFQPGIQIEAVDFNKLVFYLLLN